MKRALITFLLFISVLNVWCQMGAESITVPTSGKGLSVIMDSDTAFTVSDSGLYVTDNRFVDYKSLGVTVEDVTKTVYVSTSKGSDITGDGTSWSSSYATFDRAIRVTGNLLDVTVTIQMDSGIYYCSKESARDIMAMKVNANVDILSAGMTDTITTLTDVTQDNDTLFKYRTSTDLSTLDLDSAYVEGSFRLPVHSYGDDYVILATAESAGVGTVVTKNKTRLIINDADHIVLNYISEYSRGGIVFQNLKFAPLGNKALRMAAFGASKLKFDGCDIEALNVQNNNVIINQCHLYTTQRGIVLNNYNSFIEQSVIYGPGKSSGKSCFDIQNGNVVVDNLIIDGFGQVFENSQGTGNITFYDNSSDLYITNCEKVFSANDGFYVGSGDLSSLLLDNVDYLYTTISDKNVHIILDTSLLIGAPLIDYVESDNGIRIKPEKNYIVYIRGVHDTASFQVLNKAYVDSVSEIGGATNDILINKDGMAVNADSLTFGFQFYFDGGDLHMEEPEGGSYTDKVFTPAFPYSEEYFNDTHYYNSVFNYYDPWSKFFQVDFDSSQHSYASGNYKNDLGQASYGGVAYRWKYLELSLDTNSNKGYGGLFVVPTAQETYRPNYYSGTYLFYDGTSDHTHNKTGIRVWEDGMHFSHNATEMGFMDELGFDLNGHFRIPTDDTLWIGSVGNDNASYFIHSSVYDDYTLWKTKANGDMIMFGGEGSLGTISVSTQVLSLYGQSDFRLTTNGGSIDFETDLIKFYPETGDQVGYLDGTTGKLSIVEIEADTGTMSRAKIDTIESNSITVIDTIFTDNIKSRSDTSIKVTNAIYTEIDTLASSGTVTIDCNKSNVFWCDVTDDITSLDIINFVAGGTYMVFLKEDSGGGNAITPSSTFNKEMSSHVAFDDTGNITNVLWISSDGTNVYYSNTPTND